VDDFLLAKPATMMQSTGDIFSDVPVQVLAARQHPHASASPRPLRKVTSGPQGHHQDSLGRSASPTSGGTSWSSDTAVSVAFNAAAIPVELPSSVGDNYLLPRRHTALTTPRHGDDQVKLGHRPAPEPSDGVQMLSADATENDADDSGIDVWNASSAARDAPAAADDVTQSCCSLTSSAVNDASSTSTELMLAVTSLSTSVDPSALPSTVYTLIHSLLGLLRTGGIAIRRVCWLVGWIVRSLARSLVR